MRLQAASTRFAIATLWAYVPGASSDRRRNSGRLGSDNSSKVRSVVMCVIDSATGNKKKVSPAETRPFSAPHRPRSPISARSEEHTSELQSLAYLVCRLLLEKKKKKDTHSQRD